MQVQRSCDLGLINSAGKMLYGDGRRKPQPHGLDVWTWRPRETSNDDPTYGMLLD
jgi:hypothetical protein